MQRKIQISQTARIPKPNAYIEAMVGEYAPWTATEVQAPLNKGQWRSKAFNSDATVELDVEIGTGNGTHFAHHCAKFPDRKVLGFELKYKPLIQSIRRAVIGGSENGRMVRYHANMLHEIFAPNEVNRVFIHFPDPWPKKRNWKNRLIQPDFLESLFTILKPGGTVEFKTDSLEYFEWSLPLFEQSPFEITFKTFDLHNSEKAATNFKTQFESIFMRQGVKINQADLLKPLK